MHTYVRPIQKASEIRQHDNWNKSQVQLEKKLLLLLGVEDHIIGLVDTLSLRLSWVNSCFHYNYLVGFLECGQDMTAGVEFKTHPDRDSIAR